jgi:Family of unknown function (DUF6134)
MSRFRFPFKMLGALLCALAVTASAHAYPAREWRFNVLLDNKPIGYHSFRLTFENGDQILQSQADLALKVLGFSAYRYQHAATERWEKGCLTNIESHTRDNGKASTLKGMKKAAEFVLDSPKGETALPGCVMSFAYWNPAILKQTRLLNAESGDYLAVRVQSLGSETLALTGNRVMAKRYRLSTSKYVIDLWYSTGNQWLALETRTASGGHLRYEIEPAYYSVKRKGRYA